MKRFADKNVAARSKSMALPELVFDGAAGRPGVGPLAETLKWGQSSHLTREINCGTFRCDGKRAILFDAAARLPVRVLHHCVALALTHYSRKKKSAP